MLPAPEDGGHGEACEQVAAVSRRADLGICEDDPMAKLRKFRPTPWALTVAAWDIWRRLPPAQRRQLMKLARKHGPQLAARAAKVASRRRGSLR